MIDKMAGTIGTNAIAASCRSFKYDSLVNNDDTSVVVVEEDDAVSSLISLSKLTLLSNSSMIVAVMLSRCA